MTNAFDNRIIRLGIETDQGTRSYDESFYILATGLKYASAIASQCVVRIDNIDKKTRDYLITETSPFNLNRTPKRMTLDVGRQSYGTFRLFEGDVIASSPTQPPDIGLTFRSLTLSFQLGNIVSNTLAASTQLSVISQKVADDLGVPLEFLATDKIITNYSFTGGALKQVQNLCECGQVDAFVDNNRLVVKNRGAARSPTPVLINKHTGMIGIPEVTEQGVRVKVLIQNEIKLSDQITIESDINPSANGTYTIFKLGFELASRENPFYWVIDSTRFAI